MVETYPQVASTRLSGDEDEWRILIRWKQETPATVYTISQALDEAARLQRTAEHELAQLIRDAAEYAPPFEPTKSRLQNVAYLPVAALLVGVDPANATREE